MIEVNEVNAVEAARLVKGGVMVGPSTVRRSATIAALAAAQLKAQAELKNPPKDSINPHFKSKYADLATVRDTVLPVLTRNGLVVIQLPCELDDAPALATLLIHPASGEWIETTQKTRPGKTDPQGIGSALTYARRYALQTVAGVAAEDDDDGHAGSRPAQPQQRPDPRPLVNPVREPAPQPQQQPRPQQPGRIIPPQGGSGTAPPARATDAPANLPATGAELHARLRDYDGKLAGQNLCRPGALLAHVTAAGVKAGYSLDMRTWAGPAIELAVALATEFSSAARRNHQQPAAGK